MRWRRWGCDCRFWAFAIREGVRELFVHVKDFPSELGQVGDGSGIDLFDEPQDFATADVFGVNDGRRRGCWRVNRWHNGLNVTPPKGERARGLSRVFDVPDNLSARVEAGNGRHD